MPTVYRKTNDDPIDKFKAHMIERLPGCEKWDDDTFYGIREALRENAKRESRKEAAKLKRALLERCDGKCEICDLNIYAILVSHHVKPVADLGNGSLNNTIAICPNCHSMIHFLRRKYHKSQEQVWDLMIESVGIEVYKRLISASVELVSITNNGKRVEFIWEPE